MESAAAMSRGPSPFRLKRSAWLRLFKFSPERGAAGATSRPEICDSSFQRSSISSIFAAQSVSSADTCFRPRASLESMSRLSERNRATHKTRPAAVSAYIRTGCNIQSRGDMVFKPLLQSVNDLLQRAQPFFAADDVLDSDAVVALHHHDFTSGNHTVVDNNFHRIVDRPVQLHYRSGIQLEHVPQRKLGAAERDAHRELHLHQQLEGRRFLQLRQAPLRMAGLFLSRGFRRRDLRFERRAPSYIQLVGRRRAQPDLDRAHTYRPGQALGAERDLLRRLADYRSLQPLRDRLGETR